MVTKIELRVHAGAPSRRTDDDRYRAQAETYLGFTGRRVDVGDASQHQRDTIAQVGTQHDEEIDDGNDINLEATELGMPYGLATDDGPTIPAHDATTFVEDTQLAYNALESQLFTSSLPIPDITPAAKRRYSDDDEGSPWPADLDGHSPEESRRAEGPSGNEVDGKRRPSSRSQLKKSSQDEELHHMSSSQDDKQTLSSGHRTPVLHGLGKKRKIEHKPVFKPFKLPLKRAATDMTELSKPPDDTFAPGERSQHADSLPEAESLSSYLKTPVYNRTTPKQSHHEEQPAQQRSRSEHVERHEANLDSPFRSPVLDRSNKKPKLTDYRERTPRQRASAAYVPLQDGSQAGLAFVGEHDQPTTPNGGGVDPHQSMVSGDGYQTTSELPSSYSLSDITTQSSRARVLASQRSTSDPGPLVAASEPMEQEALVVWNSQPTRVYDAFDIPASTPNVAVQAADTNLKARDNADGPSAVKQKPVPAQNLADGNPSPLQKDHRPCSTARRQSEVNGKIEAKSSDVALTDQDPSTSHEDALAAIRDFPSTIRPSQPKASLDRFTTHVTTALHHLAEESEVKDSYRPVSVTRVIRQLERGYWLINTSSWPVELQLKFWRLLQNVVGNGNAGWGVWCTREEPDDRRSDNEASTLGTVKVFCWGEVVKHVYLLLYVASQSKVRKVGLQWLDAEEEIVVQMRGPAVAS